MLVLGYFALGTVLVELLHELDLLVDKLLILFHQFLLLSLLLHVLFLDEHVQGLAELLLIPLHLLAHRLVEHRASCH